MTRPTVAIVVDQHGDWYAKVTGDVLVVVVDNNPNLPTSERVYEWEDRITPTEMQTLIGSPDDFAKPLTPQMQKQLEDAVQTGVLPKRKLTLVEN